MIVAGWNVCQAESQTRPFPIKQAGLALEIRPALERIGVQKKIGWHSFRHGLATILRQKGVDIKTAQELLRHANSRITLDIYQQALSAEKRVAAALAFDGLFIGENTQHPKEPSEAA